MSDKSMVAWPQQFHSLCLKIKIKKNTPAQYSGKNWMVQNGVFHLLIKSVSLLMLQSQEVQEYEKLFS